MYSSRNELFVISGLIVMTLTVLALSMKYSMAMFFYDPYTFFRQALDISQGSGWMYNPFILFISFVIKIYPYSDGLLLYARYINLIFAAQLVVFMYLLARKMFNRLYSFFVACFALFLPLIHAFALQLHNDVFAAAMGFTAVYFITKQGLRNMITGFFFILIACATRPDYSIILSIPFGLTVAAWYTRSMPFKSKIAATSMIVIIILAMGYIFFKDYYRSGTRFGVIDRISLSLRDYLVVTVWKNSISVSDSDILNAAFWLIILVGIILLIAVNYKKLLKITKFKSFTPKEAEMTALFLTIGFVVALFSVVVFHNQYTIVNGVINIDPNIALRYYIPVQLFLIFGFVFAISNLTLRNITSLWNLILQINNSRSAGKHPD